MGINISIEQVPVLIPTLNRVNHLMRCIDSLEMCNCSDRLTVIVSVDYPVEEKYISNRNEIIKYLEGKKKNNCFSNIIILEQCSNMGVKKNALILQEYASRYFDYYVFLEDDVDVSCNFLKYVESSLNYFGDDKDFLAVSFTTKERVIDSESSCIKQYEAFSGQYATSFAKIGEARKWICRENFYSIIKNRKKTNEIKKYNDMLYYTLVIGTISNHNFRNGLFIDEKDQLNHFDSTYCLYMYITRKYCIAPTITKTRNSGTFDGSGTNNNEKREKGELDDYIDQNDDYYSILSKDKLWLNDGNNEVYSRKKIVFLDIMCICTRLLGIKAGRWIFSICERVKIIKE